MHLARRDVRGAQVDGRERRPEGGESGAVRERQGEVVGGAAQAVGVQEGVEGEGAEPVGCLLCRVREGGGGWNWWGGGEREGGAWGGAYPGAG